MIGAAQDQEQRVQVIGAAQDQEQRVQVIGAVRQDAAQAAEEPADAALPELRVVYAGDEPEPAADDRGDSPPAPDPKG